MSHGRQLRGGQMHEERFRRVAVSMQRGSESRRLGLRDQQGEVFSGRVTRSQHLNLEISQVEQATVIRQHDKGRAHGDIVVRVLGQDQ